MLGRKLLAEERLMRAYREEDFRVTIVRPSLTYDEPLIPLVLNSWQKSHTAVDRMLRGQKIVVPDDGTSLWVVRHNSDFAKGLVGLLGNPKALGEAFHIASDEVLARDQLFRIVGQAAGVAAAHCVGLHCRMRSGKEGDAAGRQIGKRGLR